MRISYWSSDVCSSDLQGDEPHDPRPPAPRGRNQRRDPHHRKRRQGQLRGRGPRRVAARGERKSVVEGKSVSVSVDHGGRRIMKKKIQTIQTLNSTQHNTHYTTNTKKQTKQQTP